MINLNADFNFNKHEFKIDYYEIESITDFEYLIILMTLETQNTNKNLEEIIEKFTKEDNDLKLIIERRFEKIFSTKIDNFNDIIEDAIKMELETKRLIPSVTNMTLHYLPEVQKYLFENKFITEKDVMEIIQNKYNTNKTMFKQTNLIISDEDKKISIPSIIYDDFSRIDILNLEKIKNEELIKVLIEKISKDTEEYFDDSQLLIREMNKLEEDFLVIKRFYGAKSTKIEISKFDNLISNSILEFDFNYNGRYVVSEFAKFKGLTLVKEATYSFEEFRKKENYKKFIDYLKDCSDEISDKFFEKFIENVNTEEEIEFIKDSSLYQKNKIASFNLINKMNDFNINIISDDLIALTEFFDFHMNSNPYLIYDYIQKFYKKSWKKEVAPKKVNDLLINIYNNDSKKLTDEDRATIEELISNSNLIKDSIDQGLKDIASMRSDIKNKIEALESDIDKLSDEEIESVEIINDIISNLNNFKRITNFIVHIKDPEGKEYKKDIKIAKSFDPTLIELKKKLLLASKDEFLYNDFDGSYIESLRKLKKAIMDVL